MPSEIARFQADTVLSLRTLTEAMRLEIRFGDAEGNEQIISLPLPAAAELAAFIQDVAKFMADLDKRSKGSGSTH